MGRSMPKGGGGGSVDWVELAESSPVVMFRVLEHMDDFPGRGGPTAQIRVNMAVLTGDQAGRVVQGERVIGKGITGELSQHAPGADVPARLVVLQSYGTDYAATQVPSQPEMDTVDELFPEGGEDEAWEKATAAWAEKNPGTAAEGATASKSTTKASGNGQAAKAKAGKPW